MTVQHSFCAENLKYCQNYIIEFYKNFSIVYCLKKLYKPDTLKIYRSPNYINTENLNKINSKIRIF